MNDIPKIIVFITVCLIICCFIYFVFYFKRKRSKKIKFPNTYNYLESLASEIDKTRIEFNNLKNKHMDIAVICKDDKDFMNHKKDSLHTYWHIYEISRIGRLVFDKVEFAKDAYKNPNILELTRFAIEHTNDIEKEKVVNKRKDGYYWVKYKADESWYIVKYINGFAYFTGNGIQHTENNFIEICEIPITRLMFEKCANNDLMLIERRRLLDAIPEKGVKDALEWIEKMKDAEKHIKLMNVKPDFNSSASRINTDKQKSTRPPIGITPKHIVDEQRKEAIIKAISRYLAEGFKIPTEWIEEYNSL